MKRFVLLAALAVVVTAFTGAAGASKSGPPITSRGAGASGPAVPGPSTPPSYCAPPSCLYYSGDLNISDPNATGLANWNSAIAGLAKVYQAVRPNYDWRVTGLLFNVQTATGVVDPVSTPWEIRTGMSAGNGGSVFASGTSAATMTPTGRTAFGLTEYTVKVQFASAVILNRNTTYWINVLPQCTNGSDSTCTSGYPYGLYYLSTVDPPAAPLNHYGPPNVIDDSFFKSPFFGFNYTPTHTVCGTGCDVFSVGVIGAKIFKV